MEHNADIMGAIQRCGLMPAGDSAEHWIHEMVTLDNIKYGRGWERVGDKKGTN
jgi:hypothetical protein